MPIVRVKVLIGPVTLKHLEADYSRRCDPWPNCMPKELEVDALIDTGASVSIIDSDIVEQLRLRSYGYCPISGFDSRDGEGGKARQYPNYEAGLVLLDASGATPILTIKTGQIVGHQVATARFQAILGMDVLKHCHFHLDGPGDCFEITAPEPLVEEISSVTVTGGSPSAA
jgi:hypothetical protein